MINKLICWIFGHKRIEVYFSGEYGKRYNYTTEKEISVPIVYEKLLDICPRCGANLKELNNK